LFIRNGQAKSKVLDISELKPARDKIDFVPSREKTNRVKKHKNKTKPAQTKLSRFTEYLYGRKYYILVLAFIYIIGLLAGAVLARNLEPREAFALCSSIDAYFTGVSSAGMTARIFGNIALNLVFLLGIYLIGATVFASVACSVFCLYKGLSSGFVIGVYLIGGSSLFHLGACAVNFILYLFTMIFFILACGESMSFSLFLFKSEESFRSSMSFKNITVYSSRYIVFLILISMAAIIRTVVMPVVYAIWG
jgi:hypothetical protein